METMTLDGIIPYVKIRKQGPLNDEDWETLQGVVETEVGVQTATIVSRLDDLGLSVVNGKLNITYSE